MKLPIQIRPESVRTDSQIGAGFSAGDSSMQVVPQEDARCSNSSTWCSPMCIAGKKYCHLGTQSFKCDC